MGCDCAACREQLQDHPEVTLPCCIGSKLTDANSGVVAVWFLERSLSQVPCCAAVCCEACSDKPPSGPFAISQCGSEESC